MTVPHPGSQTIPRMLASNNVSHCHSQQHIIERHLRLEISAFSEFIGSVRVDKHMSGRLLKVYTLFPKFGIVIDAADKLF